MYRTPVQFLFTFPQAFISPLKPTYISVLPNPEFVPVKIIVNPSKGSKASQVINLNKVIEFLPKLKFSICKLVRKQNMHQTELHNAGFDEPKRNTLTKKKITLK